MTQITHIISDLHLCQTKPKLFALFEHFMQEIAVQSNQLFVLGDLFEVWIGDDCLQIESPNTQLYSDVISLFKNYSSHHGELFFIHGNRDFLLSKEFEERTGGKILQEPHFLNLSNKKVALMHGDSLCTDDVDYQEFRTMVRNPQWQKEFLSLPMEKRIEIASGLRQQSKDAQAGKAMEIMDVNQNSVEDFFAQTNVDWLIHGHTHRQATHELIIDNKKVKRIVLSDWGQQGFYLSIDNNGIDERYFSL
jgi:UDP-2,3-diacylglucosamine hydrolase